MKKLLKVLLAVLFFTLTLHLNDAYSARKVNMIEYFDEKGVIEAYVAKVENASGDSSIDENEIKRQIEKALAERRSHSFKIVASEASADISIDVKVTEYFWTEEDPVDMLVTPITIAVDKAKAENYARMQADITVRNAKNGRELWNERVQSTITDDTMTKEEGYGRSYERFAKNFIKKLFRKPRKRR